MQANKLKGRMAERGISGVDLAKTIGISSGGLSLKITGRSDFTRAEIVKIKDILGMSMEDVEEIFFKDGERAEI